MIAKQLDSLVRGPEANVSAVAEAVSRSSNVADAIAKAVSNSPQKSMACVADVVARSPEVAQAMAEAVANSPSVPDSVANSPQVTQAVLNAVGRSASVADAVAAAVTRSSNASETCVADAVSRSPRVAQAMAEAVASSPVVASAVASAVAGSPRTAEKAGGDDETCASPKAKKKKAGKANPALAAMRKKMKEKMGGGAPEEELVCAALIPPTQSPDASFVATPGHSPPRHAPQPIVSEPTPQRSSPPGGRIMGARRKLFEELVIPEIQKLPKLDVAPDEEFEFGWGGDIVRPTHDEGGMASSPEDCNRSDEYQQIFRLTPTRVQMEESAGPKYAPWLFNSLVDVRDRLQQDYQLIKDRSFNALKHMRIKFDIMDTILYEVDEALKLDEDVEEAYTALFMKFMGNYELSERISNKADVVVRVEKNNAIEYDKFMTEVNDYIFKALRVLEDSPVIMAGIDPAEMLLRLNLWAHRQAIEDRLNGLAMAIEDFSKVMTKENEDTPMMVGVLTEMYRTIREINDIVVRTQESDSYYLKVLEENIENINIVMKRVKQEVADKVLHDLDQDRKVTVKSLDQLRLEAQEAKKQLQEEAAQRAANEEKIAQREQRRLAKFKVAFPPKPEEVIPTVPRFGEPGFPALGELWGEAPGQRTPSRSRTPAKSKKGKQKKGAKGTSKKDTSIKEKTPEVCEAPAKIASPPKAQPQEAAPRRPILTQKPPRSPPRPMVRQSQGFDRRRSILIDRPQPPAPAPKSPVRQASIAAECPRETPPQQGLNDAHNAIAAEAAQANQVAEEAAIEAAEARQAAEIAQAAAQAAHSVQASVQAAGLGGSRLRRPSVAFSSAGSQCQRQPPHQQSQMSLGGGVHSELAAQAIEANQVAIEAEEAAQDAAAEAAEIEQVAVIAEQAAHAAETAVRQSAYARLTQPSVARRGLTRQSRTVEPPPGSPANEAAQAYEEAAAEAFQAAEEAANAREVAQISQAAVQAAQCVTRQGSSAFSRLKQPSIATSQLSRVPTLPGASKLQRQSALRQGSVSAMAQPSTTRAQSILANQAVHASQQAEAAEEAAVEAAEDAEAARQWAAEAQIATRGRRSSALPTRLASMTSNASAASRLPQMGSQSACQAGAPRPPMSTAPSLQRAPSVAGLPQRPRGGSVIAVPTQPRPKVSTRVSSQDPNCRRPPMTRQSFMQGMLE